MYFAFILIILIKIKMVNNSLIISLKNHLLNYPTPLNLTYLYGFGSLSGVLLVIQIISGIFLAMFYIPNINNAFESIEYIMREVNYGWFVRYLHSNGASFFFLCVYLHIFRNLYYGSYTYPRHLLWISGIIIYILMMSTAFIGYVLPWGQMSFWGATVITNLFSAIPLAGTAFTEWLWGGFSVDNPTLNRFFSLHFFLPFILSLVSFIHLILLHQEGSTNVFGVNVKSSYISFLPYFYLKDLFGLLILILVLFFFIFYEPNKLGHFDNYILADFGKTPLHIVPEWYFLPFYAILRVVPNKIFGVFLMFSSIFIFFVIPFINFSKIRSPLFKPFFKICYWIFIFSFILLGWLGKMGTDYPLIELSRIFTIYYFFFFTIVIFFYTYLENFCLRGQELDI
jgi:ubiquinol-cytochrome c reductase cytochrome b subunit